MPKRAAAAEVVAVPVAKVAKRSPNVQGVAEGLKRAVATGLLSETSAKMLDLGLVGAFDGAPKERHETQKTVITMLGEVLQQVKQHAQGCLDEATSKVAELDASKSDLESKLEAAREAVKKTSQEAEDAATSLAVASQQVEGAEAASKQKVTAKADAETALEKATRAQEAFNTGVSSHLTPLQDGEFGEGGAAPHREAIMPLLEDAAAEESCLLAFPSSCEKPVTARTSFDTMVFQAVAQAVAAKEEANAASVKEQTTLLATAVAELKSAEEAVETCVQKQKAAEAAMERALATKLNAEEVAAAAQAAKDDFEPNCAKAVAARDECSSDLDDFTVYNIGCFELLRDGPQKATAAAEGGA